MIKSVWLQTIKKFAMVLGVVLWVGALSPEIFVKLGDGCIMDEDGNALTQEEADAFMQSYFLEKDSDKETESNKITYKIALAKLFQW